MTSQYEKAMNKFNNINKIKKKFQEKSKFSKAKLKQGFTLLELMIVLTILGALMAIFIVVINPGDNEAEVKMHNTAAYAQINLGLTRFQSTCGRLPSNSEGLAVLHSTGPAPEGCAHKNYILKARMLKDYYQNYYHYEIDEGGSYKVLSLGMDKAKGGEGKNADVDLSTLQ